MRHPTTSFIVLAWFVINWLVTLIFIILEYYTEERILFPGILHRRARIILEYYTEERLLFWNITQKSAYYSGILHRRALIILEYYTEERISHLLRGGSLKSRILVILLPYFKHT